VKQTLRRWIWALPFGWPVMVCAHGFGERYDLPIPLNYFVFGACATVALTFVVAIFWGRRWTTPPQARALSIEVHGPGQHLIQRLCQAMGLGLLALTTWAALAGTRDPLMNFAPTWIWIAWWVGLSLFCALIGHVWPLWDPWRTLFEGGQAVIQWLGWRHQGLGCSWPRHLGVWPAVWGLLLWSWLEVIYALPSSPQRVGWAILVWSAAQWLGMHAFGRAIWQNHADVFAIYFRQLARMAPIQTTADGRRLVLGGSNHGRTCKDPLEPAGMVGFVIAMLATVLFDGIHNSPLWLVFQNALQQTVPAWIDANGYVAGALGLLTVWLVLISAYGLTCWITSWVLGTGQSHQVAQLFLPALIPIAVGYLLAHNFSGLVIQGQHVLTLLSDPLGRQWNLWGTAGQGLNVGLVDAQTTWYVALFSIVAGHVMSVWWSHHLALSHWQNARIALKACVPLTLLMIAYTAISLFIIAQPLVEPSAVEIALLSSKAPGGE
jgi:hypothetical protein